MPLQRLERDCGIAGTGLGLATCVRIAEAWGGTLGLAESASGGAVVTVSARPPQVG